MSWLQILFDAFKIRKSISVLDLKISRLEKTRNKFDRKAVKMEARMESLRASVDKQTQVARDTISSLKDTNRKLEEALSATREELKTATEITIPGLVSANKVFIDRWDAESKVFVARMTLPSVREE